jgi:hypothetical protein
MQVYKTIFCGAMFYLLRKLNYKNFIYLIELTLKIGVKMIFSNHSISIVMKYYEYIDDNNLDKIFDFFSDNIIYKRGFLEINGIDEMKNFYNNFRSIKKGNHIIKSIKNNEKEVNVHGEFHGTLKNEENINMKFIDKFVFENGIIIYRQSIFPDGIDV